MSSNDMDAGGSGKLSITDGQIRSARLATAQYCLAADLIGELPELLSMLGLQPGQERELSAPAPTVVGELSRPIIRTKAWTEGPANENRPAGEGPGGSDEHDSEMGSPMNHTTDQGGA